MTKSAKFDDLLSEYEKIWIWSDTHFSHKNIIKYCDRPFADIGEMNYALERAWKETVGPKDMIIHVGDVAFCSTYDMNQIIYRCPGYKVLIVGNHDFEDRKKKNLRDLKFDYISNEEEFDFNGYRMWLTHEPSLIAKLHNRLNIHGHIHQHHYVENYDTPDAFLSPYHSCVSVEHTGYKPVPLFEVCEKLIAKNPNPFKHKI